MRRAWLAGFVILGFGSAVGQVGGPVASFDVTAARAHEIKPHHQFAPVAGMRGGRDFLELTLTVSAGGDVVHAEAHGGDEAMKFWPAVEGLVEQWRFTPFEVNGTAVTARVKEYLILVPPERLPARHVVAPVLKADSKVGGCECEE